VECAIFRAVHSIKGGSGTFGFQALTSLTHVLENLLDEMRGGKRQVTPEVVRLLLQAVDCLRGMIVALRDEAAIDHARVAALQTHLEALWHAHTEEGCAPQDAVADMGQDEEAPARSAGWQITFRPHPYIPTVCPFLL